MATSKKIGLIGAGRMATAIANGLVRANLADNHSLIATDVHQAARDQFHEQTGCSAVLENCEVIQNSDIIVLAIKPQNLFEVCDEIAPELNNDQLIISIAAGISLSQIENVLGGAIPVIRVMPNTPCLVGQGASAFACGTYANDEHAKIVQELLATIGTVDQLDERLLDAVTGLSGSGPAYVFQFIEALSDGGVLKGLPRELATRLATQTVLGAAQMVKETGDHPSVLKDAVASPGGTTIAGIQALETGAFRSAVISAVEKSADRSIELRNNS